MLILRDLHAGCRRFGEFRRGVPKMSPTLLSQRLKSLEKDGLLRRCEGDAGVEYELTPAGEETRAIVQIFGIWGHRWLRRRGEPNELDESFLLYAVGAGLDRRFLKTERTVIHFIFTDRPKIAWDLWWMIVTPDDIDTCVEDPGFDVDVYVESDLATLSDAWHGMVSVPAALKSGAIQVAGDTALRATFPKWFCGSPYAKISTPPKAVDMSDLLKQMGGDA